MFVSSHGCPGQSTLKRLAHHQRQTARALTGRGGAHHQPRTTEPWRSCILSVTLLRRALQLWIITVAQRTALPAGRPRHVRRGRRPSGSRSGFEPRIPFKVVKMAAFDRCWRRGRGSRTMTRQVSPSSGGLLVHVLARGAPEGGRWRRWVRRYVALHQARI